MRWTLCCERSTYVVTIYFSPCDLMIKCKHAIINCKARLSHDVAQIIVPLHVITGSDHTSGFYSHGKKQVLQKVITNPQARELLVLVRVGEIMELDEEVRSDRKAFVLWIVYAENAATCGHARSSKWHKATNWKRRVRRVQFDSHLATTPWITTCKGRTTSRIASSITNCYSILPMGHGWESVNGSVDQCATPFRPFHSCSDVETLQMTSAMTVIAMMTRVSVKNRHIRMHRYCSSEWTV